jgi:hypothetical protein
MALRKVEGIYFNLPLPEIKKTIQYRAFKVGETKNLLTALELKDQDAIVTVILDLVEAATRGKVDVRKLPMHLIDLIFLKIYTKSSGNRAQGLYNCGANYTPEATEENPEPKEEPCKNSFKLDLNLEKAELEFPKDYVPTKTIELGDNQFVKLKVPTFSDYKKFQTSGDVWQVTEQFIFAGIECIVDGDQVNIPGVDFTLEELSAWLNDLASDKLDEIAGFFKETPELVLPVDVVCPKCMTKHHFELRGLEDFFV